MHYARCALHLKSLCIVVYRLFSPKMILYPGNSWFSSLLNKYIETVRLTYLRENYFVFYPSLLLSRIDQQKCRIYIYIHYTYMKHPRSFYEQFHRWKCVCCSYFLVFGIACKHKIQNIIVFMYCMILRSKCILNLIQLHIFFIPRNGI